MDPDFPGNAEPVSMEPVSSKKEPELPLVVTSPEDNTNEPELPETDAPDDSVNEPVLALARVDFPDSRLNAPELALVFPDFNDMDPLSYCECEL